MSLATPVKRFSLWEPIANELDQVGKVIDSKLTASDRPFLNDILDHICRNRGKRLRPALVLLSAGAIGNLHDSRLNEKFINIAAALEMIHMATLVHDDVIDAAKMRRGAPSVNEVWGNKISILVGDFLFSKAFSLLARDIKPDILESIANATSCMCKGEIFQLEHSNKSELGVDDYFRIIEDKTARLIAVCASISPIYSAESEKEKEALYQYGFDLGIAFQIVDDIFDLIFEAEQVGKPTGSDLQDGKLTLPLIYAINDSDKEDKEKINLLLNDPVKYQLEIRSFLDRHKGVERAMNKARQFIVRAKENLAILPDTPCRKALYDLADYVVERKK
jgi:octaprenyl-diphosphate synthase